MPPTRSTEKVVQKPKPKPTGAATRAPSQPLDDTAQAQSDAEVSLVFMPHEDAPHDDAPRNSTPHDDTSHATASATSYSTDRVARLKAMIAAAADKAFTLACEEEQLDDSPASLERKSRILAEMKRLNEKHRELEFLMERSAANPSEAAATPSPVRSNATESRPAVPHNLPTFRYGNNAFHDPEEFLFEFERVLSISGLDVDQHRERFFHLCFDSSKARWVKRNLTPTMTWKDAKRVFLLQFGDPARLDKARHAILNMRMKPGESLSEYSRRFEDQVEAADLPDAETTFTTFHYRTSLPPSVRPHVEAELRRMDGANVTLQQLISIALSYVWETTQNEWARKKRRIGPDRNTLPSDPRQSAPLPVTWLR